MIYLIGGVPRSGKTRLAEKLAAATGVSIISLDVLREMFEHGMPQLDIADGNMPSDNAERMWKFVKAFIAEAQKEGKDYIIEGSDLSPRLVAELRGSSYTCRVVFLGYAETSAAVKLAETLNHQTATEWTTTMPRDQLEKMIGDEIVRSKHIRGECRKHRLRYVDTSMRFSKSLQEALEYLRMSRA